ncbi:MAG TPA: BamA/TamA family outer membrane protein [Firmicutes bacterium]|nr:BamA/TamA family outer membrane protein [Bacillota bacterium]
MIQKRRRAQIALILSLAVLLTVSGLQTASAQQLQNVPIIRAIAISGNTNIDTAVIEQAVTRTKVNDLFVDQNISDDVKAIYNLGYFVDVVAKWQLLDDGGIKIIFEVIENPKIVDIIIEGAGTLPVQEFINTMQSKQGEILNFNLLLDDLREFPTWAYEQHGIAIRPVNLEISETGSILVETALTRIEEIVLEGNEKTKDNVILRELSFAPGDILDFVEVSTSLQRVFMLGYFEEINYSIQEGKDPDSAVLTVLMKEQKTGSADFGAGYSSKNGLFGYIDISDDNFLGNGQRANIFFEIGRGTRSYRLGFYEPYLLSDGTSFGIELYNEHDDIQGKYGEDEETVTGTQHVLGGNVSLGRRLGDYSRFNLSLRADSFKFSGDIDEYENPYKLLTIGAGISDNTTNHPFKPSEGYKTNFNFETGFRFNDEISTYSKVTVFHSRYYELFELFDDNVVLAVRGMGGRALTGKLPNSELYRIGGSETLRGYDFGQEGLVGDKVLLVNTELRFPIYDFISGVVFADIGKAWEPDQNIDLTEMLDSNSFGLGVRLDTPLGLLRLDYGWGLNEEAKREGQFYFGLGHTF